MLVSGASGSKKISIHDLDPEKSITVSITADGRADSEQDGNFYLPAYQSLSYREFIRHLTAPFSEEGYIPYASQQNDCLNAADIYAPLRCMPTPDAASTMYLEQLPTHATCG